MSLACACVALLLAWVWLRLLNGYGIVGLFVDGAGIKPDFSVPYRLTPAPFVLAFVLSFAIVLTGTLYSSWRGRDAAARSNAMMLWETRSLCKYYWAGSRSQAQALDDVSLGIECGSLTVISGPSGSGKTTLLALLAVLERPMRGQVLFEGNSLGDCSGMELARVRRKLGFVFQDFALIPNLTAEENITYPLIPARHRPSRCRRRARELLARLGMEGKLTVRARSLSGGEQQRVAIARALAGDPRAPLADEPTSNLDPAMGQLLLSIFREFHGQGKTIVLSSHDPQAIALATSVHELEGGKLRKSEISPDSV